MLNPEFYEFHFHGGRSRIIRLVDVTLQLTYMPWEVTINGEATYMTYDDIYKLTQQCTDYGVYFQTKIGGNYAKITFKREDENTATPRTWSITS